MRRLSFYQRLGILFYIAFLMVLVSCTGDRQVDESEPASRLSAKMGGTYRKPLWSEPTSLDPALATSTYASSVVHQLFDGLVQFDADLNVVPCLAKSWQASRDGLTWIFNLRPGVTFHHGRVVTADDVIYSFTRLLDPATQSPRSWLFERVQGAAAFRAGHVPHVSGFAAPDPHTVHITLTQPYAPFISMLGMTPAKIVPRDEIERLGSRFGHQPVGTGPFRFVGWEAGKQINLQANSDYFEGRPFIEYLNYIVFARNDLNTALTQFEQGHLEDVKVWGSGGRQLIQDARYRYFRKPLLATLFLWLDTRYPPLDNVKVRRAIASAIDRHSMNREIRQGRFVVARGILPPGMPGYNPEAKSPTYDLQRARQLLSEAGFPGGRGLPAIELWSSVISSEPQAEHQAIKHRLQQIGITIVLHTAANWKQYKTEILGKRPQAAMYRYAWYADYPDPDNFMFTLFHSQSTANRIRYRNPQVDRLITQAQGETDDLKRLGLYQQAEQLMITDAPTVNLLHYTFEHLYQPYVRGIEVSALGERLIPMKKIWLEKSHHAYPEVSQAK